MVETTNQESLSRTPLHDLHHALGARMVAFAGYDMPVQYADGVLKEHLWTREHAGLFDVSHMGQAVVIGRDHEMVALAIEQLIPADLVGLAPGQMRYCVLLNDQGGIVDDLIVTRPSEPTDGGRLSIVWNASRKHVDADTVRANLPAGTALETLSDFALIALQGPEAASVLSENAAWVRELTFMTAGRGPVAGFDCHVSRSGYTGEDGFEVSVGADHAVELAGRLLADSRVRPIGLGARDSLRLEAGLCLYGNDLDEATTPIEAAIPFAVGKARRRGGAREGGFPGADVVLNQLESGVARKRVGLIGVGRAPIRAGTEIFETEESDQPIGHVTSGTFGPSVNAAIAMAYLAAEHTHEGRTVFAEVRGRRLPANVSRMPFVRPNYHRT